MNPIDPADVAATATGLRRLLAAIEAGELTASAGAIARLEGAVLALEEVARRHDSPAS